MKIQIKNPTNNLKLKINLFFLVHLLNCQAGVSLGLAFNVIFPRARTK